MHILIIPAGLILWYLAYESKPLVYEEATPIGDEKIILKRSRLHSILNEGI